MFHRKCKAAVRDLQERNDSLTRTSESQLRRVAELESMLSQAQRESDETCRKLAAIERNLALYRDSCKLIAASPVAHDRRVLAALASLPDEVVQVKDLPTLKVLLYLQYLEPHCVRWFQGLTVGLAGRLSARFGEDLEGIELEVQRFDVQVTARYRGGFSEICSRICEVIGIAPMPLQATIAIQDPANGQLGIVFRSY